MRTEFDIVRPMVDDFLCLALKRVLKSRNSTRRTFLIMYVETWPTVMPKDKVDELQAHIGDWADVVDVLVTVVRSSFLGRELFGPCCDLVLAEQCSKMILGAIEDMWKDVDKKL